MDHPPTFVRYGSVLPLSLDDKGSFVVESHLLASFDLQGLVTLIFLSSCMLRSRDMIGLIPSRFIAFSPRD